MSVRLRDVIEVLDEAYPPRLAQTWDSVGLVCGDPTDVLLYCCGRCALGELPRHTQDWQWDGTVRT